MFDKIVNFIHRKLFRSRTARWNHQYAQGQWEGLKDEAELERQQVIKFFFDAFKPNSNLLEFGCGFGVLPAAVFEKKDYAKYLGVDVSDFVIAKTQHLVDQRTFFEVGDMENYVFKEKWDAIVFNECIYYAKDVPKLIAHCVQNGLKKDGILIVSSHEFKRSPEIWRDLLQQLSILDEKIVENERSRWRIAVLYRI
jgi:SAM-dependent methyltransferase